MMALVALGSGLGDFFGAVTVGEALEIRLPGGERGVGLGEAAGEIVGLKLQQNVALFDEGAFHGGNPRDTPADARADTDLVGFNKAGDVQRLRPPLAGDKGRGQRGDDDDDEDDSFPHTG